MADDLSSQAGAEYLMRRIQSFWKKLGCRVDVTCQEVLTDNVQGGSVWVVRSDIANGLPKADDGETQ